MTVFDIDAGTGVIEVSFTTADGRLSLLNGAGVTNSGIGTIAHPLKLTGSQQAINSALLAGLEFVARGGFTGTTSIVMTSNDLGNTGLGGPQRDRDALRITIVDQDGDLNAPPVNHLPRDILARSAPVLLSELTRNMLSVTDTDAGEAPDFKVSLRVTSGFLQLVDAQDVTISGNGATRPLEIVGKLSDIDRVLAAGVLFVPGRNPSQPVTLTMTSDDRGNTGSGGAKTDTDSFTITIVDPDPQNNDPPVNHLPAPVTSDQLPLVLSYTNVITYLSRTSMQETEPISKSN